MENKDYKGRSVSFLSRRNDNQYILLHSISAQDFALKLEMNVEVRNYSVNVPLENWKKIISLVGIRPLYRKRDWTSDFQIIYCNGAIAIREIVSLDDLSRKDKVEQLEIARRYWVAVGMDDWKMVLVGEEKKLW